MTLAIDRPRVVADAWLPAVRLARPLDPGAVARRLTGEVAPADGTGRNVRRDDPTPALGSVSRRDQ